MVSKEEVLEQMKRGMKYRGAVIYCVDEKEEMIVENRDDLQTVGRVNFGELVFDGDGVFREGDYFIDIKQPKSGDSVKEIPLHQINYSDFIGKAISFYDPFF